MNRYRLIGKNVDYSLSPLIHNYLFNKYKINGEYAICNTASFENTTLEQFSGGNITIPYKQEAYALAGSSNFKDKSINTFKVTKQGFEFMSSDQYGIIDSIQKLQIKYIETRLHIIFGDGATSGMIVNCLINQFQVPSDKIYIISRKKFSPKSQPRVIDYNYFKKRLKTNYVLYNTTPLGNGSQGAHSPFDNEAVSGALSIFDATYNPTYNALAKLAYTNRIRYQNGINMLIVQALHSFEFWTGIDVSGDYNGVKRHIYCNHSPKLIICAMPFAGKSTLYRRHKTNACDLDSEIEVYTGVKNSKYIKQYGIEKFRAVEASVLNQMLHRSDIKLIFLGGGTLTNSTAINCLSNELVIYMQVNLSTLVKRFDKSRANIQSQQALEALYYERDHHYRNISQFQVGSRSIERMINEYMGY